jgi:hypothetical protein
MFTDKPIGWLPKVGFIGAVDKAVALLCIRIGNENRQGIGE